MSTAASFMSEDLADSAPIAKSEAKFLQQVRALRPLLQREAPTAAIARTMTNDVFRAIDEINGWKVLIPKRWGGCGFSATTFARAGAELSKGDPSAAWVFQILNATTWIATKTSDELQEDLFSNGDVRICGVFNPPGTAVATRGGYIVNGRWNYASGCRQATFAVLGVNCQTQEGTVTPGNSVYIPMHQLSIEDTWDVIGLEASNSETLIAKDIFVPTHRLVSVERSFDLIDPTKRWFGERSDYYPVASFLRATGLGLLVGAAEAALEVVVAAVKKRGIVTTSYALQADSQVVQRDIGEVAARLRAARVLLEHGTAALDEAAEARRTLDPIERAGYKAEGGFIVETLVQSLDKLMFIGGSAAFARANTLQKYWRDMNFGTRHIAHLPNVNYEVYGRWLLEVKNNILPPQAY